MLRYKSSRRRSNQAPGLVSRRSLFLFSAFADHISTWLHSMNLNLHYADVIGFTFCACTAVSGSSSYPANLTLTKFAEMTAVTVAS